MTFFGAEKPTPFSVISEAQMAEHVHMYDDKLIKSNRSRLFEYDSNLCNLMQSYLDIDCNDDILFIQCSFTNFTCEPDLATIKNWSLLFENKFCLVRPIHVCVLNRVNDVNTYKFYKTVTKYNERYEELYECEEIQPMKYDKIVVKNCLKYYENDFKEFNNFVLSLFKSFEQSKYCLLVIQRIADLNTLPFYTSIVDEWSTNDTKYTKFIEKMQQDYFTIKWDIELVKCTLSSKSNWYRHLKQQATYPLNDYNDSIIHPESMSFWDVVDGLRELDEGIFKYQQVEDAFELNDRLLFIGAYHRTGEKLRLAERKTQEVRYPKKASLKQQNDLKDEVHKLSMQITSEIRELITNNHK